MTSKGRELESVSSKLPQVQELKAPVFGLLAAAAYSLEQCIEKEREPFRERATEAWTSQLQRLQQANLTRRRFRKPIIEFHYQTIEALKLAAQEVYPADIKELHEALGGEESSLYKRWDHASKVIIHLPNAVLHSVDATVEEVHRFITFATLTPLGYNHNERRWEGVVPGTRETEVLGGLLYRSKETTSVRTHGQVEEHGFTENPTFISANLPAGIRADLARQVIIAYSAFTGRLAQLVSAVEPFTSPSEIDPHIAADVYVINHSLSGMAQKVEEPESARFAATLMTGLTRLRQDIAPYMEQMGKTWTDRLPSIYGCVSLPAFLRGAGFKVEPGYYSDDVTSAVKTIPRSELPALPLATE